MSKRSRVPPPRSVARSPESSSGRRCLPTVTLLSIGIGLEERDVLGEGDVDTETVFIHGIASAHAICPSKPRDVAMSR